ncbi:MAG: protein kinase [bacterium]|nr:protein kinase [bacterium]
MSAGPTEMELFLAALEKTDAERAAFVADIEPPALRARIERLLDAHDDLDDRDPLAVATGTSDPRVVGLEFDGFRILSELGRGGMGVVYEAQQATPKRRVAIKTLPLGRGDADSQRRLEREAATLARLSHPGIAQVHGCGHTAALGGVPYLVMERVDGVHLDAFCRQHNLSVRERLELLATVCDAVGHAHDQRIVHRDLKPQNVLVQHDGTPKVLDFGIARHDDAQSHSLLTRTGQVLGTLAYMAPEQLAIDADAPSTDARSDVYALGVIGYEMLSGRLPIAVPDTSLPNALRTLVECEPESLGKVVPPLRGDVDLLIGKAIDRDAARRYADANAMARDLRRFLANEPVAARAPSRTYQVRKFVQRHRGLCTAVAAVVLTLTLGLAWALVERGRSQSAQADAEVSASREQLRARAMARTVDFVHSLLAATTPEEHGGASPTLEETVDALSETIESEFGDDSFASGNVHLLLVEPLHARGQSKRAAHHLAQARAALLRSELTGDRERTLLALGESWVLRSESRLDDAIAAGQRAWESCNREHDRDGRLRRRVLRALCPLLTSVRRDLAWAEARLREELATLPPGLPVALDLQNELARVLDARERHDEALTVLRATVAAERSRPSRSVALAIALQNEALLLQRLDRAREAIAPAEEALTIYREVFADRPHTKLALAIDNLATVRHDTGDLEGALTLFAEAEELLRSIHDEPHVDLAVCLTEFGRALASAQRRGEARARLEEACNTFESLGNEPTPQHAAALEHLGMIDGVERSSPERIAQARRAVAMRRSIHGENHFLVARALECLAYACIANGDFENAEAAGRECQALRAAKYGERDWRTWSAGFCVWLPMARRGELDAAAALIERALPSVVDDPARHHGWIDAWYTHLIEIHKLRKDEDAQKAAVATRRSVLGLEK